MTSKALTRLLFKQGGQCFFCNKPLSANTATVEHLVARANRGGDQDENRVACCQSVNQLLGSMSLKDKIKVCLNQKGQFECPNGAHHTTSKRKPQAAKKATNGTAGCYEKVVANLKQRGSGKPRTVAKLKNTIASLFPKKLSPDQVDSLVQQLQSQQVIIVDGSKVTYFAVSSPPRLS